MDTARRVMGRHTARWKVPIYTKNTPVRRRRKRGGKREGDALAARQL